jgi:four helix bundle protein
LEVKVEMIQSYRDLEVYKRSYELALDIHRVSFTLPETEKYELSRQIRRAAMSIPLNIAEGYGRKDSKAEFKHFLRNAMGSSNEVRVLIDMFKDLGYLEEKIYQSLVEEYEILGKQINKLIKNWQ